MEGGELGVPWLGYIDWIGLGLRMYGDGAYVVNDMLMTFRVRFAGFCLLCACVRGRKSRSQVRWWNGA